MRSDPRWIELVADVILTSVNLIESTVAVPRRASEFVHLLMMTPKLDFSYAVGDIVILQGKRMIVTSVNTPGVLRFTYDPVSDIQHATRTDKPSRGFVRRFVDALRHGVCLEDQLIAVGQVYRRVMTVHGTEDIAILPTSVDAAPDVIVMRSGKVVWHVKERAQVRY